MAPDPRMESQVRWKADKYIITVITTITTIIIHIYTLKLDSQYAFARKVICNRDIRTHF